MSIGNRLRNLERATGGGDECRSCGYPLPAEKWPAAEWYLNHGLQFRPIEIDADGDPASRGQCPGCGRRFDLFGAISLAVGAREVRP